MDNKTIADQVKLLVGQAETDEALRVLITFLKTDTKWRSLEQEATETQAQYASAKREANAGRISYEQAELTFNRVNNRVLRIAEVLENPAADEVRASNSGARSAQRVIAVLVGFMVLAAAGFGISRLFQSNGTAQSHPVPASQCPKFKDKTDFKILLWEYKALFKEDTEAAKSVPVALQNRLASSIDRNWPVESRIFAIADTLPYPTTQEEALKCNAQLAIWGTTERIAPREWILITKYAFSDSWRFSRWTMTESNGWEKTEITATLPAEGSFVDTITSFSSIFTQGKVALNIEALLKIAIGLNASRAQDSNQAIASLESMKPQDSVLAIIGGMLLAETYSATGKEDKAAHAYQQVLKLHPNYSLALNNYAAIQLKQGDYIGALSTLNTALAIAPDNADVLAMRGTAYMGVKRLDWAKRDLVKASKIATEQESKQTDAGGKSSISRKTQVLRTKLQELEQKIEAEKQRKADADALLNQSPTNLEALNIKAEASKNLGDFSTAIKLAQTALKKDPENVQAIATLAESYAATGDTLRLQDLLKKATRAGVQPQEIKENAPLIRTLPDAEFFRKRN